MADTRKKHSKKCGVCGDNALGSNFNAITCESCKAFFRRNALKTKEFKCPFDDSCNVDVVTRRFCQKCRLKKCFDIGMKKEWIMTEEEKKAKKEKIEQNRQKRSNHHHVEPCIESGEVFVKVESPDPALTHDLLSPASMTSPLTPQTPSTMGVIAETPSKNSLFSQPLTPSDCEYSPPAKVVIIEDTHEMYSDTVLSSETEIPDVDSDSGASDDVQSQKAINEPEAATINYPAQSSRNVSSIAEHDFLNRTCRKRGSTRCEESSSCLASKELELSNKLSNSVYEKAVAIQLTDLPIRSSQGSTKLLSSLEKSKLQELVVANRVLKLPLSCGITDPSLLDVINMTDHAIRRLIKMSKKIVSFKNLCQNDQIALLKGGCTELMILRSVMSYDPEKECWNGPYGPERMSIKVDILKEAKGNVYEEHKRFINSFLPEWRADENIMLILSGIALFMPERPNIVHKDVIKLEQDTYYYLLLRYLESIYGACEAKSAFLRLIHRIEELHILNENHIRVYLDVNPKDVEPLLIEIFDLKH